MRSTSLDLVKWLAMLTMVIDHLRYLWPEATAWLFVVGRFAFPLFCLGIAANVSRSSPGDLYSENNFRYLSWLLAFSLLSELPYRALSETSNTLNVMPTLMLGLIVAWSVHHSDRTGLVLGLFTLIVSIALHDRLMYGAFGVLLPATMVLAVQRPWIPGSSLQSSACWPIAVTVGSELVPLAPGGPWPRPLRLRWLACGYCARKSPYTYGQWGAGVTTSTPAI